MNERICGIRKMRVEVGGGRVGYKMYNYNYIVVIFSRYLNN